jgi:hypothetical protein
MVLWEGVRNNMAEKANKKGENITIHYDIAEAAFAPNRCKASTSFGGEKLIGHGTNWDEAKQNVLGQVSGLKALGEPPADEEIDLG